MAQAQDTGTVESMMDLFIRTLGKGWGGELRDGGADGYVAGPGGEKFWVDLRNINGRGMTCSMRQQVFSDAGNGDSVQSGTTTALEEFAVMVADAYPAMATRHAANLALIETIYRPIREFAAEVAAHLGDGWTADVHHTGAEDDELRAQVTLTDAQGHSVTWRWGSYGRMDYKGPYQFIPCDKWHIYGTKRGGTQLYDAGYRDGSINSINVSAKHTAKRVAGEITRRLLPEYFAAFDKAVAMDHAAAVYTRDRDAAIDRVNRACPLLNVGIPTYKADDGRADGRTYGFKFPTHPNVHVEAEVSGHNGGTVDLAFNNIPVGVAERLLEAWAGIVEAQGEGAAAGPQAPAVLVEVSGGCVQTVFAKGLPEGTELCVIDYDNDEDENGNPAGYSAGCWYFDVEPDAGAREIFRETAGRDW